MGLGLKRREAHTDTRHKEEGHKGSAARGLQVGRRDPEKCSSVVRFGQTKA